MVTHFCRNLDHVHSYRDGVYVCLNDATLEILIFGILVGKFYYLLLPVLVGGSPSVVFGFGVMLEC